MAQHFLLSARARTLSLATVLRMTDEEAETAFVRIRWHATDGKPVCPHCGCETVYSCRKAGCGPRWRCKACREDFSVTSGTLFAHHKMPLRNYLAAIAIFCNEVKGKSALALSRDLDVQYKTAFVLAHKLREAMASDMKGMRLGGQGETAEIDGAYFGGFVRQANHKENRRDRRLAVNQNGKRRVVVVIRERGGRTLPEVFKRASQPRWDGSSRAFRPRHAWWPMKPVRGMICTLATSWTGSTTVGRTAWMAFIATAPKASSHACVVAKSAITITSLDRISFATPRSLRGAKIIGGRLTAVRFKPS